MEIEGKAVPVAKLVEIEGTTLVSPTKVDDGGTGLAVTVVTLTDEEGETVSVELGNNVMVVAKGVFPVVIISVDTSTVSVDTSIC